VRADTLGVTRPHPFRRRALLAIGLLLAVIGMAACDPSPPAGTLPATISNCPLPNGSFTYGTGFGTQPNGSFHPGVDMGAPLGTPVYAVRNGTLWYYTFYPNGTSDLGGYSVYLLADDGNTYYYTHLTPYPPYLENTRHTVRAGDQIESVNHTGNATYDHLHFEVRLGGPNGTKTDPRPILDAVGCQPKS
jgi:murein DD-endopeptidase MepM/ murein hydrolase activator NlpD